MFKGTKLTGDIKFVTPNFESISHTIIKMKKCASGKKIYLTEELAIEALIEARTHSDFRPNQGPVAVYRCDDCGEYHLTSKGAMNEKLTLLIKNGKLTRLREASEWEKKLRR